MFSIDYNWILIAISFITYFLVSWGYKQLGVHNLHQGLAKPHGIVFLNIKHIIGIGLFGILFLFQAPEFTTLITVVEIPRLPVLLLIFITVFACSYVSYQCIIKTKPTFIRQSNESPSKAWMYFVLRIGFLFCYEFFFRGVLLYSFLKLNSPGLAIVFTTTLYVIIHIFDSKKEILGTIPFGLILALFTILTNTIWYAFFVHLTLSLVYEIALFYYQTLRIKTTKKQTL